MAASRAFNIAEILEAILIDIDMKTLLLAQRVSRIWEKFIIGSTPLQKKLFMLPATTKDMTTLGVPQEDFHPSPYEAEAYIALNPLFLYYRKDSPYPHSSPPDTQQYRSRALKLFVDSSWKRWSLLSHLWSSHEYPQRRA